MLEYDRIDISEEINIKKTNASKDIGFKYEPHHCNGCPGLMQKSC